MEALFCSKCNEKIVEEHLPCKYCGSFESHAAGNALAKDSTAQPQKSKLIILILCLVVVVIAAFIFLR
ncbi:hypothetical protein SAMN03159341_104255 [Paenibacillus sp. 1_12]|nr:hypothetical protein SAMN03159341_104255 [Paenibacillus sp. 1_12]